MTADDAAAMKAAILHSQSVLSETLRYELAMLEEIRGGYQIYFGDGVITSRRSGGISIASSNLCNELREFLIDKLSESANRKASEVISTIGAFQLGATAQQITEITSQTTAP